VVCGSCGATVIGMGSNGSEPCPRCGTIVPAVWHGDLEVSWMLFVLGTIGFGASLFLPFVGYVEQGYADRDATLYEGISTLWHRGAWEMALVVFLAVLMLPLFRCIGLGVLLWADDFSVTTMRMPRMRLLRILQATGRWVFLEALIIGAAAVAGALGVHLTIDVEAGLYLYAVAGILMSAAVQAFDVRRIWLSS
jgi:paraquat-inducible protein A